MDSSPSISAAGDPQDSPSTSLSALSATTTATSSSPHQPAENLDSDDDFFGSSSPGTFTNLSHAHPNLQSDIPQLRRTHVTNGYREGLSAAKETSLQTGFDVGFPIGAAAGMKAGWIIGVLQGLERSGRPEDKEKVQKVLKLAREGLSLEDIVEVINAEDDAGEIDHTKEDKLVMEDVRVREDLLETWQGKTQQMLDQIAIKAPKS